MCREEGAAVAASDAGAGAGAITAAAGLEALPHTADASWMNGHPRTTHMRELKQT